MHGRNKARRGGLALAAALLALGAGGAQAQAASIQGTVVSDFDADGVRDQPTGADLLSSATDTGLPGVRVTAFGADGAQLATTTSGAPNGDYTLTVPNGAGAVRVEFSGLPAGYRSGPFGADNGTSVQFVTVPGAGTVGGIDFAAAQPADYCRDNPTLVTCRFSFGGTDINPGAPAVVAYRAQGGVNPDALATKAQVGSVYGEAVGPDGSLYVAAYLKRHTGFGPGGIGAIYRIPRTGVNAATGRDTFGTPTVFSTVPNVGADPRPATNNYLTDNPTPGPGNDPYDLVGKQGLGDIETSPDGSALYAVNLNAKTLVRIPLGGTTGTAATSVPITAPAGCAAADWRPFGLGQHAGSLYVGGVCSGQSLGSGAASRAPTALFAAVYTVNPATSVIASTPVLNAPLGTFSRKCADRAANTVATVNSNPKANCPGDADAGTATGLVADWRAWSDDAGLPAALEASVPGGLSVTDYAQPMLSSISFDGDDMVVGMRDRWGDQIGYETRSNDPADTTGLYTAIGAGDVYRACRAGAAGSYTLENNGQCLTQAPTLGQGNAEGPGGGEFFFGDDAAPHDQTSMGAVAKVAGFRDIQTTAVDPTFDDVYEGGIVWLDAKAGNKQSTTVTLYPNDISVFGKANGLGDLEAICLSAPLQIGNRVFTDADRDGVQDAGEPGLAGVTVQLVLNGAVVKTATTNAAGQYLFGNVPGDPFTLTPNASYTVRIPTGQPVLAGLQASPTTAPGAAATIDSNGAVAGTFDAAAVTTGAPGENDHTIDFGFFQPRYDLALRKTVAAGEVQAGDVVPFTIRVFNQSPDSGSVARNIQIIDQLPEGLELADPDWTAGPGRTASTTIPGPLAPGADTSVEIFLRVLPGAGGDLVNRAEITAFQDTAGGNPTDIDSTPDTDVLNDIEVDDVIDNSGNDQDDEDLAVLDVRRYDLALRKTTPRDLVSVGEDVPFTVTVFNQSPDAGSNARNITVTDYLPAGLAFDPAANPGWEAVGDGRIRRVVEGPLAPGASVDLPLVLRVTADAASGTLTNRAEISAFQNASGTAQPADIDSTPDSTPDNDVEVDDVIDNSGGDEDDADPASVRLVRYDLALRKTVGSAAVKVGDLVPFTVEVFNQATDPAAVATGIRVVDEVPRGFSFAAADNPGWTATGTGRQIARVIPGPLNPGTSIRVPLRLRVSSGATDATLVNLAEICSFAGSAGQPVPDVDSTPDCDVTNDKLVDDVIDNSGGDEDDHDVARVRLASRAVLAITKTFASRTAAAGTVVSWRVRVRNTSSVTATNVVVCDVVPAKLAYVSASVPAVLRNGRPCFKLGTLKAKASRTFTVRTRIVRGTGGTLRNVVRVTADNAASKRASDSVKIKTAPEREGGVTG